jgi:GTP-binding protein Era
MTKSAKSAIGDVDVVILMIEPIANIGKIEEDVLEKAKSDNIPLILLINKIDTI